MLYFSLKAILQLLKQSILDVLFHLTCYHALSYATQQV